MACLTNTALSSDGCLLQELDWERQDVVFHNNTGKNVELLEKDTIVSRVKGTTATGTTATGALCSLVSLCLLGKYFKWMYYRKIFLGDLSKEIG